MTGPTSSKASVDRFSTAGEVAEAVLYEGYVLYPYRASSGKNQMRWQFGVLAPRGFSEADGSERWSIRTECVVRPEAGAALHLRIRCLQIQRRSVEASTGSDRFVPVDQLDVDGRLHVAWDEAVDQVVDLSPSPLHSLDRVGQEEPFTFTGGSDVQTLCRADGTVAGRIVRRRQAIDGRILIATETDPAGALVKVMVTVENTTVWTGASLRRNDVMDQCLAAVHTMLAVDGGRWVSSFDPPADARAAVEGCRNDGTFPVLIGDDDVVLSSPIILYDHPEVAPESPGDFYDATEIDEILALRVLTLTDDEKSEARVTDPKAAAIIDRVHDLPPATWDRLHGAVRDLGPHSVDEQPAVPWWDPEVDASVDPWADSVVIAGVVVQKGAQVELHPSHRSDAQDLFLHGLTATVAGIFTDVDGEMHVAVTVDDDPATEALAWQGRYLFFHPDEVVPVPSGGAFR